MITCIAINEFGDRVSTTMRCRRQDVAQRKTELYLLYALYADPGSKEMSLRPWSEQRVKVIDVLASRGPYLARRLSCV